MAEPDEDFIPDEAPQTAKKGNLRAVFARATSAAARNVVQKAAALTSDDAVLTGVPRRWRPGESSPFQLLAIVHCFVCRSHFHSFVIAMEM